MTMTEAEPPAHHRLQSKNQQQIPLEFQREKLGFLEIISIQT